MPEEIVPHEHSNGSETGPKKDCGCGCSGDCEDAKKPQNRARRAFLLGTGTTVVATLVNRRAFAAQGACQPISNDAVSLTHSANGTVSQCGGLTPGYWAQHQTVSGKVLGYTGPQSGLKTFLTGTTLGSLLPALALIDPTSAAQNFCSSWQPPRDDAGFHWACAILCALASVPPYQYTPSYGYTINSLNEAIMNAYNDKISASTMLSAIETLENDYNTNNAPGGAATTVC
jgi:hypothetical protein